MDFITDLQQALTEQSAKMIAGYDGDLSAKSLSEMEIGLKQMTHELGNAMMQQWLEAQAQKYPDDEKECPHCKGQSKYVRRRQGLCITLQGRVYYRRAYYTCTNCQQGFYPLDVQLGIEAGQMSVEVHQLALVRD